MKPYYETSGGFPQVIGLYHYIVIIHLYPSMGLSDFPWQKPSSDFMGYTPSSSRPLPAELGGPAALDPVAATVPEAGELGSFKEFEIGIGLV